MDIFVLFLLTYAEKQTVGDYPVTPSPRQKWGIGLLHLVKDEGGILHQIKDEDGARPTVLTRPSVFLWG